MSGKRPRHVYIQKEHNYLIIHERFNKFRIIFLIFYILLKKHLYSKLKINYFQKISIIQVSLIVIWLNLFSQMYAHLDRKLL